MAYVCIVSWYAYPLFDAGNRTPFGGSEVRAWLLGTGLAKAGKHRVSFVVFDHGQGVRDFSGVRVYPHSGYRWQEPTSESKFAPRRSIFWRLRAAVAWRVLRLWRRLRPGRRILGMEIPPERTRVYAEVAADVYCVFGVGHGTAEVVDYCRSANRPLVLFIGTDEDLSEIYRPGSREVNAYGSRGDICHYVLTKADLIVTQTSHQQGLLKARFGLDGVLLRNPAPPAVTEVNLPDRGYFLWVGKSDTVKRPDLLLDLARMRPQYQFLAVINHSDAALHSRVLASCPPNVRILESVYFQDMAVLFARAIALVNTSRFEGFANAFLQAGGSGVPVASLLVDPDGILVRHECGIVSGDSLKRLADALDVLAHDPVRRTVLGANFQRYVASNHALADKVMELSSVLDRVAASRTGP